jgi:DNA repair ATPase RecN
LTSSMLQELKNTFQKLNNELYVRLGQRDSAASRLSGHKSRLLVIEQSLDTTAKASLFLQTLSDVTRQQITERISGIVTDALQKVKDPNLEFRMHIVTERNQVEVKFVVHDKTTDKEYDIIDSCGGSIADIVTYPLKIALLLKWEPVLSRIMILDENFKFVSVADQEPLGEFVRQVSEKLNLQTLLITHSPVISSKGHRIFEVAKSGETSKVEEKPS